MAKITIRRGTTYRWVLRWADRSWRYVPITAFQLTAPLRVTAPLHNIPDGWPVVVFNAAGSAAALAPKNAPPRATDYRRIKVVDFNTLEFNDVVANLWKQPPAGAILGYNPSIDLTDCTVRMQARDGVDGPVMLEASQALGNVDVNVEEGYTALEFTPALTSVPTPGTLIADVELVMPGGNVAASQQFEVEITEEVTRES